MQVDPVPYGDAQAMLSDTAAHASSVAWSPDRKEPLSWVMAFLDNRPARVSSIVWRYAPDQNARSAIPSVDVFGSLVNPVGPWTKLGTWKISPAGDSPTFRPAGAPPLRYVRFVAAATEQGYGADLPLHLSVREIPIAKNYHSVLALPVHFPRTLLAATSASAASTTLALNKAVHGQVQRGIRSDTWSLDLQDGTRAVRFTLANMPAIGAALAVKAADGADVALAEEAPSADVRRYTASIGPGRYKVIVSEPPRSIALLWDTSSSVSGSTPAIIAAVRSIAQDASPGRDEINLFPFHDPVAQPLLKAYSGDPATLFSALQAYDWKDLSSGAEGALLGAIQTLAHRPGRRGIIMLTDAETSSAFLTPQLWQAIAQTQPQIFTLSVPTTSADEYAWKSRNLMTDWATATGGFNAMIGDQGETQAAFQRAAAMMRGWAPYALTVSPSTPPPPPPPGTLRVTFAAPEPTTKPVARDTVALLLDASGSMLQTIKGRKKIDIARSELDHLVRDVVPDGTPVTLRVYGQGGRGSCRSDLMMPLAPLDRAKAEAVVARVVSTNGAKTATAASLRATADDLAAAQGVKRVILITDGGENCGGNVEAEIAALKKSGIDVQLDIVGFAIDTPQTGQTFARWAQLGGGRYYEASDAVTLDGAMRAAVKQQFEAVNAKGRVAASGDVGGNAVTLPAGHYRVRLRGQQDILTAVDVEPNTQATAALPP